MQQRLPPARGRLHAGRRRRRGPDPRRRRPPQLPAGGRASARARTSSAPTSRRSSSTPARRSSSARTRSSRSPATASRSPASTARRPRASGTTSTGTSRPPRRTATTGSCARRSSSSRARSPTRCWAGTTPTAGSQLDEMRLSDDELRDVDKIIIIACGTAFYAGLVAKYAIEHWTRIPCEVELAHEFRYRDPILTRRHAGRRDQPVRRDRRHADGDPARPRAALEGAGDLQHQRLDDPARVRRGDLHPRRPRDRGRVDQGLHHPAGRLLPARALPRPGRAARKYGDEIAPVVRRARARCPATCSGPRQRRRRSTPWPRELAGRAVGAVPRPARRASRSRSRARSSSRSWPTSTPRASRPASSSTARSR